MNTCVASAQFEQFCDIAFSFVSELKKIGFCTGMTRMYPIGYPDVSEVHDFVFKKGHNKATVSIAIYENLFDKNVTPYVRIDVQLTGKFAGKKGIVKKVYIERSLNSLNKCLGSILKQVRFYAY